MCYDQDDFSDVIDTHGTTSDSELSNVSKFCKFEKVYVFLSIALLMFCTVNCTVLASASALQLKACI